MKKKGKAVIGAIVLSSLSSFRLTNLFSFCVHRNGSIKKVQRITKEDWIYM
jgi:hypothetical protein